MALTPGTLTVMLDAAWRVSLVLAAAWGATRLLGRRPAALRHAVWAAALVAALAVPMLTGVVPSWRLAVLPADAPAAVLPHTESVPASRPVPAPAVKRSPVRHAASIAPPDTSRRDASVPPAPVAAANRSTADWLGLLWASVAAAIIGRYFASVASVRWLTRSAEPVTDARWRDASDIASAELGLTESPALVASDHITVPFTTGVVRPVVVVPTKALTTWSDERIRVVLLHELAHVRRRDCLVQAMAQIACAAYWFNPLTWIAARRLRAERERACDDLVLDAGTRGSDYAQHLLDIARTVTPRRSLSAAALAMARPSELEGRLLAILDGHRARRAGGRRFSWSGAAALVVIVLPIASVQPVAREASVIADDGARTVGQADATAAAPLAQSAAPSQTASTAARSAIATAHASRTLSEAEARELSAVTSRVVSSVVTQSGHMAAAVATAVADGASEGVSAALRELGVEQPDPDSAKNSEEGQSRPVSPAVVQGLTEAMKDSDPDVRKQALQALTRLNVPLAYETLIAALKDEDEEVRQQAAFTLGQKHDSRAIEPLIAALKDAEPDVRQQAAFALGQLGAAQAVPALQAVLKDTDEDVRQQAIFALSQIGDRSAMPAFVQALKDESEDVRQQALFGLSQIGDTSVVAAIVPLLLKDESEDVRQQAAFALSQIGDESAVEALTTAMKDPSPEVRRQAIFALSQIADGDTDNDRHRPHKAPTAGTPKPMPAPTPTPSPSPTPTPRPR